MPPAGSSFSHGGVAGDWGQDEGASCRDGGVAAGRGGRDLMRGAAAVVELAPHAGGVAAGGGAVAQLAGALRGAGFKVTAARAGLARGVPGDAPGGVRVRIGELDQRSSAAPARLFERRGGD